MDDIFANGNGRLTMRNLENNGYQTAEAKATPSPAPTTSTAEAAPTAPTGITTDVTPASQLNTETKVDFDDEGFKPEDSKAEANMGPVTASSEDKEAEAQGAKENWEDYNHHSAENNGQAVEPVKEPVKEPEESTAVDEELGVPCVWPEEKKGEPKQKPKPLMFNMVQDIADDELVRLSGDFGDDLERADYVGNSEELLSQARALEKKHRVTLPLEAYGLSPIVARDLQDENGIFTIKDADGSEVPYQLFEVDGVKYLACRGEALDSDYLHQVISEARSEVMEYGTYDFVLRGLRLVHLKEGEASVIYTLRLNVYEMSVLMSVIGQYADCEFDVNSDGLSYIHFTARQEKAED